nr:hypothetical protein [Tanacetum cinerariifolium]
DCDPEEEIRLIDKLLYDNSSPHPLEEFISENSDAAIESFSPSPIPVEDSDSLRDAIDLSLTPDDSMPLGIEDDDYDSEKDIIVKELLSNDSLSLLENDSFHLDIPSSPRRPAKPPDDDEIKPNLGILTVKMVGDIPKHYVPMPRLLATQPTLVSNQEKSPHLLSHRGLKAFQLPSKSRMMILLGTLFYLLTSEARSWRMRARRFLQGTGRNLGANGPTSMGFDMSKVECYNCHKKGHFARECRSPKDTRRNGAADPQRRSVPDPTNYALMAFLSSSSSSDNEVVSCSKSCTKAYVTLQSHYDKLTENFRKSQFDVISYQIGLESVEARLLIYKQNEYMFEEDIKLLKLEVQLRDNALVSLRQTLEKAEQEKDDLKLKLEKFQTSSKNLTELLAKRDGSWPPSSLYDRFQSSDGYHAVPPPYTGTFMPPKPDLVFNNAPNGVETGHSAFNVKLSPTKLDQDLSHTYRPSTPIIEDWHVETSIPVATTKPASPKPIINGKSRNRKACFVYKSLDHLIKDCDYHEKKMAQPTARNQAHRGTHKHYAPMTHLNPQRHMVPTAVLTQSKLVSITAVRPVSTAIPKTSMTRPRHAKPIVTKPKSPIKRHINRSPYPKVSTSPPRVTAVKALVVNAAQGL